MKRYSIVRILSNAMEEGDIGVFIGDGICREAFAYDRPGNLYLEPHDNMFSVVLGLASCTQRRVFMFCDDEYFLRNMSELAHIAISRCENIYIILLVSGKYISVGKHPTIYDSVSSMHGILFNMGFIVHDYKRHFKNSKNPVKEINVIWSRIRGPLAVILRTDEGIRNFKDDYPSEKSSISKVMKFIIDGTIPTTNYVPPISFDGTFGGGE